MRSIFSALVAGLMVASCSQITPATSPITDTDEPATMSSCALRDPTNIEAWINAMPGMNDNPKLIVQFKAIAPTPGYSFDLEVLTVMESYPPMYIFELVAAAPIEPVIQVETEIDVRIEKPNFDYSEIANMTVKCGGEDFFHLDEVETAH